MARYLLEVASALVVVELASALVVLICFSICASTPCRASCQLGQNAWAGKGDFHCSGGLGKSLLIDHSAMCSGRSDLPCTSFSNLLWLSTMPGCRRHVTQCRV